MKKSTIFIFLILLLAGAVAIFRNYLGRPPSPELIPNISIKEIQKTDGQDIILLSNGDVVKDLGYDTALLEHLKFEGGHSIFIFKSYSCRACEPNIRLWLYSTQTKAAEDFDFPGRHFIINSEGKGEEISDFEAVAVSGNCYEGQRGFWLALRGRNVESDGASNLAADQWNKLNFISILYLNDGKYSVNRTSEDKLEELKALNRENCHHIEGEDRHDYL